MNRKERRKQAKLNRSNSKNNVVSLFPSKPKFLPLDDMAKDIGFDLDRLHTLKVSYDIDVYGNGVISYDAESNTFTILNAYLGHCYKTFLQCKQTRHAFAVSELIKCLGEEEAKDQHEMNILGCLMFFMHIRFDTNVILNNEFLDLGLEKDELDTLINYGKMADNITEAEITDALDTIPWVNRDV